MVTLERNAAGLGQVRRYDPGQMQLRSDEGAVEQRIRIANGWFFWSTRLLPAPRRKAMHALYVFCGEVSSIADGKASRTLRLALLADWHAQIALLYAGRPERPVTRALRDAVDKFDLRGEDFLAIIEGMKTVSSTDLRAPSYEQLDLYCEQTAVAVSRIALRILGAAQPDGERLAAALGRGMQLTGILRDLVEDAVRQRLYLPRELLHAHGIFATMPSYVLAQPALPQVCNALAERATAHFADAERAIPAHPRSVMLATTAMLSSYSALLRALLARGWARLDEQVRPPVWHQMALLVGHGLVGR
jgi:squalene synthase HpnD